MYSVIKPCEYLRAVAIFLHTVSIVTLILSAFFMIVITVEGAIFNSLQTVGCDYPPSIPPFFFKCYRFACLLATFSLAVALPL
jgi:hypothetical protein